MPANTSATSGIYDLTKPVQTAHPNLFEAKAFMRNGVAQGKPKFSINLVTGDTDEDFGAMKKLSILLAREAFPGRDIIAEFKANKFALPFANGTKLADHRKAECEKKNKKPDGEYMRGKWVIAARSIHPPKLGIIQAGKIIELTDDSRAAHKDKFYFGVEALVRLNFKAYTGVGQNPDGVTAYLNGVLSLNRGEHLSSGVTLADSFSAYAGHATAENPLDDEIPF